MPGYVLRKLERPERFNDSLKRLFLLRDSLSGNHSAWKRSRARIRRRENRNKINAQSIAIDKLPRATENHCGFALQGRQPVAYRLMDQGAVPACDFANRMLAVRKLARPAPTPVYQELVARGADRLSATMKRGTGLS